MDLIRGATAMAMAMAMAARSIEVCTATALRLPAAGFFNRPTCRGTAIGSGSRERLRVRDEEDDFRFVALGSRAKSR